MACDQDSARESDGDLQGLSSPPCQGREKTGRIETL